MVRVGIAGIGFMGMIHFLTYRKLAGVKVVALCDVQDHRLAGNWTDIKGNFGPAGEQMDLMGIRTYKTLDEMLANEEIDLVDLTLPPATHADATVAALRAGKHVFCEKPMSLSLDECSRMAAAAQDADRQLFVGHVLPFFAEYTWAYDAVSSGQYGKLKGGSFRRVISDPAWLVNFWNPEITGGPLMDLHIHDAHFIRLLFGMPERVMTNGRMKNELPEFWHSLFTFADSDCVVEATSGTTQQQGRAFNHGFEIHLEKATLLFEFAVINGEGRYHCPPTVLHESGEVEFVDVGNGDPMFAFEKELGSVINCLQEGTSSSILSSDLALDAVQMCHMQKASLMESRSGAFV